MNSVTLTGRLVRDPQIRYASQSQMAVANFTLAVDRVRTRDGKEPTADFPDIVAFGKTARSLKNTRRRAVLSGSPAGCRPGATRRTAARST